MSWEYREADYTTALIVAECSSCEQEYEGEAEYGQGIACWTCPNCNYDNETERD